MQSLIVLGKLVSREKTEIIPPCGVQVYPATTATTVTSGAAAIELFHR